MIEQSKSFRGMSILVSVAAFVIIIAGISLAQSVVVLLLVSFFLALLGTPPVLWLKEKRIPSGFAVSIVITGMVIIIILIGAQIGSSFSSFSDELPLLQSRIREQVLQLIVLLKSKGLVVEEKFFLEYVNPEAMMKLTAGILIALWMYILGVQFPILWGFLAFLLHYIPNIGSVIAAIPAALLALVQLGMGSALLVIAGNIPIGFIIGNVIEPRLMGRKFGLSTLVVFLSLIFWGSLLGFIGAILSIPLTMTLKFAFESNERTRWIAVLLGSEKMDELALI